VSSRSEASSALEIAADVRAGRRAALDVVEEHLARIEQAEREIHAFNLVTADEARRVAASVDAVVAAGGDPGPLAGVPVALKDNLCTRGVPTTCSSKILDGWRPPYDATVVQRLAAAGAVAVGKTNLDEFAMGSSTENSAFGPTRNPRDPSRVPGGSSGGSAAAVAAGFAALALGSDTGGSIRQPAALCGVVGVKPTYGVVSRYGLVAFASSLDQIGPFAASVAEAAALFDVIAGPDPADSTSLRDAPPRAAARLGEAIDGLRVGVVAELAGAEGMAPDVAARTRDAAEALAEAGAKVEEVSVPAVVYGLSAYYLIAPAEASSNLARYDGVRYGLRVPAADVTEMYIKTRTAGFGAEVKRRIMLGTYALSAGYYDAYYGKAQQVRTLIIRDFAAAYESFDVLLAPTAPTTAFPLGAKTADPLTMYLNDVCTIPSNLAGHPAISVPFGVGDDGLPIGVQVMAPALGETVMFQVASALERARPAPEATSTARPAPEATSTARPAPEATSTARPAREGTGGAR
jgi:aspartyl-tRNA(Asn)/glutamyl-tRNA(Gln) amidotransferase subunit A